MKTLFFLAAIALAFVLVPFEEINAQPFYYYVSAKTNAGVKNDTLLTSSSADTASVDFDIEATSQSVRAVLTKVSGNVSTVKVYLQGRFPSTSGKGDGNWEMIDSLAATDKTLNTKTFNLRTTSGNLIYPTYRFYAIASSGTETAVLKSYQLRWR